MADPPEYVINVIEALNVELINYLKRNPTDIYRMHPRRFEELIAEILAAFGWYGGLTASTRDGGFDIFAISNKKGSEPNTSWLIECKRWMPERKIGIEVVRSLYGVRTLNPNLFKTNILIATTSDFSSEVYKLRTSRYELDLNNCSNIIKWINNYHPRKDGGLYLKDNHIDLP